MVIRFMRPALLFPSLWSLIEKYGRKRKVRQNLACSSLSLMQLYLVSWLSQRLTIDLPQMIGSKDFIIYVFFVHNDANYRHWLWFFVMIAWMYCVGDGWRSCEDTTMSKSLPVASLFCWFCKYEVHELVYFLTFRKNGFMFCFVLLVTEVKVFYLNDPPFCFWYRNIDMSNFCVGLGGVNCEVNHEPHMFSLYFR